MTSEIKRDNWFLCPKPRPDARSLLFCLPFAGGGASIFHSWHRSFAKNIEIRAVQLPGRESRFREPRITNASILGKEIADALDPYLDQPFSLFGYSMGALLAFEVTRELRRRGKPLPACLFLAAMHAPQKPGELPPMGHLPDKELLDHIDYYFQPTDEAWKNPELREVLFPILRDDFLVGETYKYADEPPLPCPINVYAGSDDRAISLYDAEAWQDQTTGAIELNTFPGGHFFSDDTLREIQRRINRRIIALIGENS